VEILQEMRSKGRPYPPSITHCEHQGRTITAKAGSMASGMTRKQYRRVDGHQSGFRHNIGMLQTPTTLTACRTTLQAAVGQVPRPTGAQPSSNHLLSDHPFDANVLRLCDPLSGLQLMPYQCSKRRKKPARCGNAGQETWRRADPLNISQIVGSLATQA